MIEVTVLVATELGFEIREVFEEDDKKSRTSKGHVLIFPGGNRKQCQSEKHARQEMTNEIFKQKVLINMDQVTNQPNQGTGPDPKNNI